MLLASGSRWLRAALLLLATEMACQCFAAALPQDLANRAVENNIKISADAPSSNTSQLGAMPAEAHSPAVPKKCYHFFVARNMSSLLSEATKMLRQIREKRERDWILTFIYRIKSLAEHLRSHPEAHNYDCLPLDGEERRTSPMLGELYFDEDSPSVNNSRPHSEESPTSTEDVGQPDHTAQAENYKTDDNQVSVKSVTSNGESQFTSPSTADYSSSPIKKEGIIRTTVSIKAGEPHSVSGLETTLSVVKQSDTGEKVGTIDAPAKPVGQEEDDPLVQQLHFRFQTPVKLFDQRRSSANPAVDTFGSNLLRQETKDIQLAETRESLLEDMVSQVKKLRELGGTQADILTIWKLSEIENENYPPITVERKSDYHDFDFDYEELGAAAGELETEDRFLPKERTVAPSLGEVMNFNEQSSDRNTVQSKQPNGEDYDVLVKQLEAEKFNHAHLNAGDLNFPSETTKVLGDHNDMFYSSTESILAAD